MNIKEVKDLIHTVLQSDINEFELEHTGTKLRIQRGPNNPAGVVTVQNPPHPGTVASLPATSAAAPAADAGNTEGAEESGLHIISSPIVGTFYRAPSPESDPFVRTGDRVAEGTILCLIEAMKLMNEVPSDIEGEIVHIYVENGTPVEYGQKLFAIRPHTEVQG